MGPQKLSSPGTEKGDSPFTSLKSLFTRNSLIKNDFLPRTCLRQEPWDTFAPPTAPHPLYPSDSRNQKAGPPGGTRWPLLTPWRAALKGPIHVWGLKAPLSPTPTPAGGGCCMGTEGVWTQKEGMRLEKLPVPPPHHPPRGGRVAPVSRSPPDLSRDPFVTPSWVPSSSQKPSRIP